MVARPTRFIGVEVYSLVHRNFILPAPAIRLVPDNRRTPMVIRHQVSFGGGTTSVRRRSFAEVVIGASRPQFRAFSGDAKRTGDPMQFNATTSVSSEEMPIREEASAVIVPIREESIALVSSIREGSSVLVSTIREESDVLVREGSDNWHSPICEESCEMDPWHRDESRGLDTPYSINTEVRSSVSSGIGKQVSPVVTATICEGSDTDAVASDNVKGCYENILTELCSNSETHPRVMTISLVDDAVIVSKQEAESDHVTSSGNEDRKQCSHMHSTPHVMMISLEDDVRLSRYSGSDNEDLAEFVRSFEDKFAITGKDDNVKGKFFLAYLKEDARDTVQEVLDNNKNATFDQLVESLKKRFMNPALNDRFKQQLRSRTKRAGETVEEFYRGVTRLVKRIHSSTSSAVAKDAILDQFLYGLDDNIMKMHVKLSKPKTPQDALETALSVEGVMTMPKHTDVLSIPRVLAATAEKVTSRDNSLRESDDVRKSSVGSQQCYYCQDEGHYAWQCPEKARRHHQPGSSRAQIGCIHVNARVDELQQALRANEVLQQRRDRLTDQEHEGNFRSECYTIQCRNENAQKGPSCNAEYKDFGAPASIISASIPIEANDYACLALVDTGAAITLTSGVMCSRLGLPEPEAPLKKTVIGIGNASVKIAGSRVITFTIGSYRINHRVHITAEPLGDYDFLLGIDLLSRLPNIGFDFREAKMSIGKDVLPLGERSKCQECQRRSLENRTLKDQKSSWSEEAHEGTYTDFVIVDSWAEEMESSQVQEAVESKPSKLTKRPKLQSTPKRKGTCHYWGRTSAPVTLSWPRRSKLSGNKLKSCSCRIESSFLNVLPHANTHTRAAPQQSTEVEKTEVEVEKTEEEQNVTSSSHCDQEQKDRQSSM
ncbi:hypothetical protein CRE_02577 [Caenorhabditis remanei]|uniref:CCHC-type domain-containing protein n=1 Tax=Caenorhabditis remanei TaxID=31234 RepID=E3N4T9_CAERE|nr:hypothetical protein CRE_02577 [Caenorhabditis remanei]